MIDIPIIARTPAKVNETKRAQISLHAAAPLFTFYKTKLTEIQKYVTI